MQNFTPEELQPRKSTILFIKQFVKIFNIFIIVHIIDFIYITNSNCKMCHRLSHCLIKINIMKNMLITIN